MRDEKDVLFGVAVVLHDVTRFRLLDDAKTNLVSTVSHEIKTPLTSVRMVLHLLLEKAVGPLTPRQSELLVTTRDDAERLLNILNDLLDLTRLVEGNIDIYKEMTPPGELVHNVADIMREALKPKDLKLTCNVEQGLPQVLVDRQRINHVFTNLLNNAIKVFTLQRRDRARRDARRRPRSSVHCVRSRAGRPGRLSGPDFRPVLSCAGTDKNGRRTGIVHRAGNRGGARRTHRRQKPR